MNVQYFVAIKKSQSQYILYSFAEINSVDCISTFAKKKSWNKVPDFLNFRTY